MLTKKIITLALILAIAGYSRAQQGGIRFDDYSSLEEVKNKAKAENKYLFIDVFATYCGPCKEMDQHIYPNDTVGGVVNSKFIAIKVQIDTAKTDNENVKRWYADARQVMQQYKITALPTFLFFAPGGKLVHRGIGFKQKDEFIALVNDATDPQKQYYTLKENYERGIKDYAVWPGLSKTARELKENEFAGVVATDYIDNYLVRLKDDELYTKDNLLFMASNVASSKQSAFSLFTSKGDKINTITGQKNLSKQVVDYIIYKEIISPAMKAQENPTADLDWNAIHKTIKKKYGAVTAERNVLDSKKRWYSVKKSWPKFADALIAKIKKFGVDTTSNMGDFYLNNDLWMVFLYCNDKKQLTEAAKIMEGVVRRDPKGATAMDTYANLLYKAGRKDEALKWEEKAVSLSDGMKEIAENFEKMKKGENTWSVEQ